MQGMDVEDIEERRAAQASQQRRQQHGAAWGTPSNSTTVPRRPLSAEPAARRQGTPNAAKTRTRAPSPGPRSSGAAGGYGGTPDARGRQMPLAREFEFATAKRGADARALDRMQKIEQERLAQCTFRPNIQRGGGPDYVKCKMLAASRPGDLYERQLAWAKRRDEQMEEERLEIQRERERECTFQPKINSVPETSDYAFSHRRDSSLDSGPRGDMSADCSARKTVDSRVVSERLYNQGLEHKRHMQEKLRERLQDEMQKLCTFKPAVNPEGRVRDPTPVRSRYLDSPRDKSTRGCMMDSVIAQEERDLQACILLLTWHECICVCICVMYMQSDSGRGT